VTLRILLIGLAVCLLAAVLMADRSRLREPRYVVMLLARVLVVFALGFSACLAVGYAAGSVADAAGFEYAGQLATLLGVVALGLNYLKGLKKRRASTRFDAEL